LFNSRRGISNNTRSPIRCTLNRPDFVCAWPVTTRAYGSGFAAPPAALPPCPPRPPRPAPPPPVGVSVESCGLGFVGGAAACRPAVGAGAGAGAGAVVVQPIAMTATMPAPRVSAELVLIKQLWGRGDRRQGSSVVACHITNVPSRQIVAPPCRVRSTSRPLGYSDVAESPSRRAAEPPHFTQLPKFGLFSTSTLGNGTHVRLL